MDKKLSLQELKSKLIGFNDTQKKQFLQNQNSAEKLIHERASYIDHLVCLIWDNCFSKDLKKLLSLVAVGGYGRNELHPFSDIDILILLSKEKIDNEIESKISTFVNFLWDLKLEIGHSVRTVEQTIKIAKVELSVATNLLESRLIVGNNNLYTILMDIIRGDFVWNSKNFFLAKKEEQDKRRMQYKGTGYNLEPDLKSSPGTLRDIHTIDWIVNKHFRTNDKEQIVRKGFFIESEYRELEQCKKFLWKLRFALHISLKRKDNRLTFESQTIVSKELGYSGENNEAVEKMMKELYRVIRVVLELNGLLLQLFEQTILKSNKIKPTLRVLDDNFQVVDNLINVKKPALFQSKPESILELFIKITQDTSIVGVSAKTIRLLRSSQTKITKDLIDIPSARKKFMTLLKAPNFLKRTYHMLNEFNILSNYFPQWRFIVGQMQFDLFHVYTVDEHSIKLLSKLKNFEENSKEHPLCSKVFNNTPKKYIIILSCLFHDIGKGRKGDHSEIGANEVYNFALKHDLSISDAETLHWLVKNHLLMSLTAQKRDIYDPEEIISFSKKVKSLERLEYLLCLTVADICATNPSLWNGWKRSLISELYAQTKSILIDKVNSYPDIRLKIRTNKLDALKIMGFKEPPLEIKKLWRKFGAEYFLRHNSNQIAFHTKEVLMSSSLPNIAIKENKEIGGTEIFVYCHNENFLFSKLVHVLDRKKLNIVSADIFSAKNKYIIDYFLILDVNHKPLESNRYSELRRSLKKAIEDKHIMKTNTHHYKNSVFNVKPKVNFPKTISKSHSILEITAMDKLGLLTEISEIFSQENIILKSAKIATIGEKAQDTFVITNLNDSCLNETQKERLKLTILHRMI